MVKGVSRQVIVVRSPDPKLFEQAIFILKDDAVGPGITDSQLLSEAQQTIRFPGKERKKRKLYLYGPAWACAGAAVTAAVWWLSTLI